MSTNVNLKQNIPAFMAKKVITSTKREKTRAKTKKNGEGK